MAIDDDNHSGELSDDLRSLAPQSLLRDLHRPALEFDKQFEIVDPLTELRVDPIAVAAAAMRASWKPSPCLTTPSQEAGALCDELRAFRNKPWAEIIGSAALPNRRVKE